MFTCQTNALAAAGSLRCERTVTKVDWIAAEREGARVCPSILRGEMGTRALRHAKVETCERKEHAVSATKRTKTGTHECKKGYHPRTRFQEG